MVVCKYMVCVFVVGIVDARKDLDCEVVFHPSFLAPEDGQFALQVHGGNMLKLKCLAKVFKKNLIK